MIYAYYRKRLQVTTNNKRNIVNLDLDKSPKQIIKSPKNEISKQNKIPGSSSKKSKTSNSLNLNSPPTLILTSPVTTTPTRRSARVAANENSITKSNITNEINQNDDACDEVVILPKFDINAKPNINTTKKIKEVYTYI